MKFLTIFAMLGVLAAATYAEARQPEAAPPAFAVIEADARLPFSDRRISGYQVGRDNSLIVRAGPSRWYRATLWPTCARELRWAYDRIALDTRPGGTLDRFGTVIVRGFRCPIRTFDRIERPVRGTLY